MFMMLTSADLMNVVDWSRAQFAMTAIYHWLFVPLTLGLGPLCAIMETIYVRTGDPSWRRATKFWMRLFGINFAAGVATGLILEFEFGTNWSNYSHFVGDIFGAPLAIEGIVAFFMEATFLAVMFFGWNRVSKGFHLASTWLVAIGANLSALWILVANAWMQNPVGTAFNPATARNEMTSFWEVLFSPTAMNKFSHTVTSGFVLGAIVMIGVSAWYLLRGRERKMALGSIRLGAVFGGVASLLLLFTGHTSGGNVAATQPMKLAAMEGLYDGQTRAGLSVIGVLKPRSQRTSGKDAFYFNWEIPGMLSWTSFGDADAWGPGINDLVEGNAEHGIPPMTEKIERGKAAIGSLAEYQTALQAGDEATQAALLPRFAPHDENFRYFGYGYLASPRDAVPNVPLVFYSFRVMVGLGCLFLVLFAVTLWLSFKKTIDRRRWLLRVMVWMIPLAYLSTICGWVVAEMGRQPWVIQDLMPTVAAVSRVPSTSIIVTFYLFLALFTALLIADLKILTRQIKIGPGGEHDHDNAEM
jgi:cytochrome d ubiquinol oxidase subunit I